MKKPRALHTHLDKYGRIVIPKPVRTQLGITADTPLALSAEEDRIIIERMPEQAPVVEEDGVLVYTGDCTVDLNHFIREHRDKRLDAFTFWEKA